MTDFETQFRALVEKIVDERLAQRPAPSPDRLLSVAAFARQLSISERTVRDAIREKRLDHVRIGRAVRIPAAARIEPRVDVATARARLVLLGGKR